MNIVESKKQLKEKGYTSFELSEFDINFYNKLLNIRCNEINNIKKYITYLRADTNHISGEPYEIINANFITFENAKIKKEELCNSILQINKSEKNKIINSQIWYFSDGSLIDSICMSSDEYLNYIKKIMMYFFDIEESQEYSLLHFATYYDKGCVLKNHSDGTGTGRVCALLIYLNEEYDEKNGGILILNNKERVIPTFGKVAIIDLESFDIPHEVTEVTGGLGRFALLTFVSKK